MRQRELEACDREPIHVPGSIQPHGILLVADPRTGVILQSAGDTAALLGARGSMLGQRVEACLGLSLADLERRALNSFDDGPAFLGSIAGSGDVAELVVRGQQVDGVVVLEIEPASWPYAAAETITRIRSAAERIGLAEELLGACRIAASEIARVSGYDRVLIYRFLPDGSGAVIVEQGDAQLPSLLNHRFPASDVPAQARALYRRNMIRVIPNAEYAPAPLNPPLNPLSGQPLDMSHCSLRSVSPTHVRYLKNMGVAASMSVSLMRNGELWGLIACHHGSARLVPLEAQEICAHIGQILSQKIAGYEDTRLFREIAELGAARESVLRVLREHDRPGDRLFELGSELLTIVPADGLAILGADRSATIENVPVDAHLRALETLALANTAETGVYATNALGEQYPRAAELGDAVSGMLAVVAPGLTPITLIWFRAAQVEEINWAGNPHERLATGTRATGLTPRRSFATWRETVRGQSQPWTAAEIESAQVFADRVGFLVQQQHIRELNRLLHDAAAKLATLAATDSLTELANHRTFMERLVVERDRNVRTQGSLALLAIDVDYFKPYNDHLGHPAGDACLRQLGQVLRAACHAGELAARTGGEEFCMLLPDTGLDAALARAEAVRAAIEGCGIAHPTSPMGVVTVSIGVAALATGTGEPAETLRHRADDALYQAKHDGRNRVACARARHPAGAPRLAR